MLVTECTVRAARPGVKGHLRAPRWATATASAAALAPAQEGSVPAQW